MALTKEDLQAISEIMEQQTREIKLEIENRVTRRIDALSDGYKLTCEKQWEQERRIEDMERRIEALENQTAQARHTGIPRRKHKIIKQGNAPICRF